MTQRATAFASARARQRGAALLLAMLTVVLVATLASAMLWQQWRSLEVEKAQRMRVQSHWLLTGALDWARLILREDARQGGSDNLTEPWAVPLAPARLSTFLAAQHGQATVGDDDDPSQEAFLSGQIDDLQARLNVANLVKNGALDAASVDAWARLFKQLKLPQAELERVAEALLQADLAARVPAASGDGVAASSTSTPAARAPLLPRRVDDLRWLGLSAQSLQTLTPFITVLPVATVVNLNTAPLEVLLASVPELSVAQAQRLIQTRATQPFNTLLDAMPVLADPQLRLDPAQQGVSSRFFSVTGRLRVGDTTVLERSVIERNGLTVTAISRQRGVESLAQWPTTATLQ